jgi:polyisoprenoid-binding protein YceI
MTLRNSSSRRLLASAAAVLFAVALPGFAQVDASKSTVVATSKQMNVPVDGAFKKFTAQVAFDPAKPTAGSTNLSVDMSSYDLGDAEYNKQVRGKEWFDSTTFPKATFVSTAISPAGGNQYKVTGKLTIKGKSQVVTLLVAITQQGATQTFDGSLPIKRTLYEIGTGEWKDTSVVADDVVIKFHIVAAQH